jgi:3',5'-cyclic AMP phosphodiesterase CpdA
VVLTFVTVGDSREEAGATYLTPQDAIWLQNTRVWSRIMQEARQHRPELLFFNGDMIMGYKDASVPAYHEELNRQYAFWRGMVTQLLEGGTYVVPVPGNHETQDKAAGKKSKVANEVLWRDNMADLVLDAKRFAEIVGTAPGRFEPANNPFAVTAAADAITTDQRQLTYSFDVGTTHFAVVNTDPVGNDAHAPAAWLAADFAAARAAGAKRFFVFGHKPAFSYFYGLSSGVPTTKLNGLDAVADLSGRDAFWKVIEDHGATYFCGHEHIYNVSQPKGAAYQVIVGSGGSPFESDAVKPIDRTYAYAVVDVYASGRARVTTYGFSEGLGPTRQLASWRLK